MPLPTTRRAQVPYACSHARKARVRRVKCNERRKQASWRGTAVSKDEAVSSARTPCCGETSERCLLAVARGVVLGPRAFP